MLLAAEFACICGLSDAQIALHLLSELVWLADITAAQIDAREQG